MRQGCAFQLVPCQSVHSRSFSWGRGPNFDRTRRKPAGKGRQLPAIRALAHIQAGKGLAAPTILVRYAQGSRFPLNKLIPCAYSFAIETLGQAETPNYLHFPPQFIPAIRRPVFIR